MTIVLCIEERDGEYKKNDRTNIDNIMYFLYDQNKKMFDIYVKRGDLVGSILTKYKPYSLSLNIKDVQNFIDILTDNNSLSFILFDCNITETDFVDYDNSEQMFNMLDGFEYEKKYNTVAYDGERLNNDRSVKRLYSMLELVKRQY
jgi:hypothetical protein